MITAYDRSIVVSVSRTSVRETTPVCRRSCALDPCRVWPEHEGLESLVEKITVARTSTQPCKNTKYALVIWKMVNKQ